MNKYLISFVGLMPFLVLIIWMVYLSLNENEPPVLSAKQQDPQLSKVIKYRIKVSNPGNQLIKEPSLIVAIPADITRHVVSDLSISVPYKKVADERGNISVEMKLDSLMPYQTRTVDITVNLAVFPVLRQTIENRIHRYTQPEKYIEANNKKIMRRASLLKADTKLEQARKTYDWVIGYLSDAGFIEEDRGALYAFKHKTADCTGYMYLYGALLRANDIPARMMSGFVVKTNKKLKIKDYHNWVEVYLDGSWRVVDPQKKKFLKDESDYIAMRIVNNSKNSLFDNSQQLFKAKSGIKVSMN